LIQNCCTFPDIGIECIGQDMVLGPWFSHTLCPATATTWPNLSRSINLVLAIGSI
jgi:hypothetical protein